jgi:tetratricopeptide (TPR) repeat protein
MRDDLEKSNVLKAIEALKRGDRGSAVGLLYAELNDASGAGDRWRSISRLAFDIGAIDIGLEASRRFSCTQPITLERLMHYWGDLANYGRTALAGAAAKELPAAARAHPVVQHFLGTIAGQKGDFAMAEQHFRSALAMTPGLPQTWFALAMIKTFEAGDDDFQAMQRLRPSMAKAEPALHARFLYALAKACHDVGDTDTAFAHYSQGAALRQREMPYNAMATEKFAAELIRDFTPQNMARLTPGRSPQQRSLFVNGLPRSGTTLVEQILTSHSQVADGAEINLFRAALIPTRDYSYAGAAGYQQRMGAGADPWGRVAGAYHKMLSMRFQTPGLVVDKTLSQSHFMGLIMHALPSARVIWMRRRPEDTALSCFRNFFSSPIPWSWSLIDMAHYFRIEDRLYAHWKALFPLRILTVEYEDLVRDPALWIPEILTHCGLEEEPGVYAFHQNKRSVRTASVQQVRSAISTSRVGSAEAYSRHLSPFTNAYFG